jgi:hypothetical protein
VAFAYHRIAAAINQSFLHPSIAVLRFGWMSLLLGMKSQMIGSLFCSGVFLVRNLSIVVVAAIVVVGIVVRSIGGRLPEWSGFVENTTSFRRFPSHPFVVNHVLVPVVVFTKEKKTKERLIFVSRNVSCTTWQGQAQKKKHKIQTPNRMNE